MKVFWSWQSDRPSKATRAFIQSALESALAEVASDLDLSPAERPELDHDTKGEAGLVEIVKTIFEKIEGATAFVADVTPIAITGQGKQIPNPNVMIELGHAMKALGHESIILIANTVYGGRPEDLPFDLRHRRGAITYHLRPTDDEDAYTQAKERLVADLTSALSTNLKTALSLRDCNIGFERHPASENDPSTWLAPGELIEHGDFFGGAGDHVLSVHGTTRSYFRITPSGWINGKPTRREVRGAPESVRLLTFGSWLSGDGGANRLGTISVGFWQGKSGVAHTATQWFEKTGEVWGFDGGAVGSEAGRAYLGHGRILKDWSTMLIRTLAFYQHFGAKGPYNIEVGVGGLDGVYWPDRSISERTRSLESNASHIRTSRDWSPEAQITFLTAAYNQLCNAFNRAHVSEVEVQHILASVSQ